MKETKENGITLIALIVTVIILLILAGVSISMVSGDGLFSKARSASETYKAAANNETKILEEYENFMQEYTTGGSSTPTTYTAYTLGQEVTVGGEQFFVIEENDTTSKSTITLITKYNLARSSNAQLNAAHERTTMEFCTDTDYGDGYWERSELSDLNGIESERATVYNKAKAYGESKGGTGRLLTRAEANTLTAEGKIPKIIYGQDYTTGPVRTDNFLNFWLGSAVMSNVYCVEGENNCIGGWGIYHGELFGVRPVIIVSKALVSIHEYTTYTAYTLGQEVTVGGEQFFVIEEDDTTSYDTITLITKYNLDPSSNVQLNEGYSSTRMEFCTDPDSTYKGYWGDRAVADLDGIESERATVYNKAIAYGLAKGGIGRLLTFDEANSLVAEGKIPKIIFGQDYTTNPVTTDNYLNFWLGSTYDSTVVGVAKGNNNSVSLNDFLFFMDVGGVRPVITVLKSLVS